MIVLILDVKEGEYTFQDTLVVVRRQLLIVISLLSPLVQLWRAT